MVAINKPVPMISALALGPLPELVQSEMGDRALDRVFRASGLSSDLLFDRNGFIPEPATVRFFGATAKEAGERFFLGPWVSAIRVRDYGIWGEWVLSASTLRDALYRGTMAIGLHGSDDKLILETRAGVARYSYKFSASSTDGYEEVAIGGVAAITNLCREYLGPDWVPDRVGLNVGQLTRRDTDYLESCFGCPLNSAKSAVHIEFDVRLLKTPRRIAVSKGLTYEDLFRDRITHRPQNLVEQISALVQRNLSDGLVHLDETARSLDLGPRTLQNRLSQEGVSYRDIVKKVRVRRAKELLTDNTLSVTQISHELGYENLAHFTRMFTKEVGLAPSQYASSRARYSD